MNADCYILGGGGMAREIYEIYVANGTANHVMGFIVQKGYRQEKELCGKPVFDEEQLLYLDPKSVRLVSGIGSPLRKKWIDQLEAKGYFFDTVVHPFSSIGNNVTISGGVVVLAGAVLTTNITIGKHTIINAGATISHDVVVDEYCTVSPGVHIAGRVVVGRHVFVGIGAICIPDIRIGEGSFIGAGSVVVEDVLAQKMYYGVPAKAIRNLTEKDWIKLI